MDYYGDDVPLSLKGKIILVFIVSIVLILFIFGLSDSLSRAVVPTCPEGYAYSESHEICIEGYDPTFVPKFRQGE